MENQFPVLDGFEKTRIATSGTEIYLPRRGRGRRCCCFTRAVVQVTLRGTRVRGPYIGEMSGKRSSFSEFYATIPHHFCMSRLDHLGVGIRLHQVRLGQFFCTATDGPQIPHRLSVGVFPAATGDLLVDAGGDRPDPLRRPISAAVFRLRAGHAAGPCRHHTTDASLLHRAPGRRVPGRPGHAETVGRHGDGLCGTWFDRALARRRCRRPRARTGARKRF